MPEFVVNPTDDDAVLKEVWSKTDIETKTELTDQQIERVNKLLTLSDVFGNDALKEHLNKFMALQKSRNRSSMREFVDVVRARREDFVNKGQGFFKSMMG